MFIKYIMQSSSTFQKFEYDFVPVWIAQMVPIRTSHYIPRHFSVTIQNGWNNRISYGCVYAQIRSGLGMHLGTYSNHDTVLFLLIVPIKGRFV